ncbi:MAG TPA: hypothetical protein VF159_04230 [Gemmatimonadaceae bacterium]
MKALPLPTAFVRRRCVPLLAITVLSLIGASRLPAQVTETPIAFDSAGHVRSVTPALQSRLGLTAPTWPVTGDYVEARLFSISGDGYVIVVERKSGALERFSISQEQASALRTAVSGAMVAMGRVSGEEGPATISEPARGAFVRNQMVLATVLYGPAVATLTHDASAGTAAYLATVGGSFFLVENLSKQTTVTKSQNDLATDGALRGTAVVLLSAHALGANLNADLNAGGILIGGLGGSILGYQLGRGLTQSEAQAMSTGSTLAALGAVGVTGSIATFDSDGRLPAGVGVAAGIAGYMLGPSYPRRAQYTVTAGDIQMLRLGALLGVMTAGTPIIDAKVGHRAASAILTAGLVAGVWAGDRVFVRPYDHTQSEASLVSLGAVAGGLMGIALPLAARSGSGTLYMLMGTGGAILGTLGAEQMVAPRRAGAATPIRTGDGRRGAATRLRFDPTAIALAAAKANGKHSILSYSF